MQAQDTTVYQPGTHVHMLYIDARPGEDGGAVIDERVVLIREIDPDGLTFRGWCVRRWWEHRYETGYNCRRRFSFDRIIWGEIWDGKPITTDGGAVVVPGLDGITWLADRLAAQRAAEEQPNEEARAAEETRRAYAAEGLDYDEARREEARAARRAERGADLIRLREERAAMDARIAAGRAAKEAAGLLPAAL
jgi:hypothetical protein